MRKGVEDIDKAEKERCAIPVSKYIASKYAVIVVFGELTRYY